MSSTIHDDFADLSRECCEQFGDTTAVTFRRVTTSGMDPATGKRVETNADTSCAAVRHASRLDRDTNGAMVSVTDFLIEKAALALVPKEGDRIIDPNDPTGESKMFHVMKAEVEVGGTMYKLTTRNVATTKA